MKKQRFHFSPTFSIQQHHLSFEKKKKKKIAKKQLGAVAFATVYLRRRRGRTES